MCLLTFLRASRNKAKNPPDLKNITDDIKEDLEIVTIDELGEVVDLVLN
jgi:ATP-dependent Lon protease